jgi:spore maturation protein CgeB
MRIALLDTYYSRFLANFYAASPERAALPYETQRQGLLDELFGTSDFYSRHLKCLGHEAEDFIVNAVPMQTRWADEAGFRYSNSGLNLHHRLERIPFIRTLLPGLAEIAVAQIKAYRPDVLYCQDLAFLPPAKLRELKRHVKLIVGQIASPLPPAEYLQSFDLITTSFPHFVPRLRAMGIASEYFRIAFDTKVLERLGPTEKDVDISFVGGISRDHRKALSTLEYLAQNTPIEFFGYGANSLNPESPIRPRHHGEVWGLDMYRSLARSRITLNRHIDVAENNANNMRLFEATGVGTMLLTDRKDNLGELFEIGKEVVTYSSPEEAAELIRHYLIHPDEAQAIAQAGQARTLRDHTYRRRMEELVPILEKYLTAGR